MHVEFPDALASGSPDSGFRKAFDRVRYAHIKKEICENDDVKVTQEIYENGEIQESKESLSESPSPSSSSGEYVFDQIVRRVCLRFCPFESENESD